MQTLLKENYLTVEVDTAKKLMIQTWVGFCNSEQLRDGHKKSFELFSKNKCDKFICNTKDAAVLKKDDTEWATANVTPALVKAGVKSLNFVIPDSAFAKMSLKNLEMAEEKQGNVKVNYYQNIDEAIKNI